MMSGRIITPRGGTFDLWMDGATQLVTSAQYRQSIFHNRDVQFRDLPVIQSVEIEINSGFNGKFSISIAAPYDLGLELLDSELFSIGNRVEVQVGYPRIGLMTPWFGGTQAKPSISLNADNGLTATLNVEGGAFASTRNAGSVAYSDMSYLDIISEIARQEYNNWEIDAPGQRGENDPLHMTRSSVSQGGRSDWGFIHHLVRQAECDMYPRPLEDGSMQLVIRRRQDVLGSQPQLMLVCRSQVDFINRFPLLSFETDSPLVWLPRGFSGARTSDIDRDSGETRSQSATQQTRARAGVTRTGDGDVVPGSQQIDGQTASLQADDEGRFVPSSSGDPSRTQEQVVNQEVDEAAAAGTFVADVTTIGMPTIYPETVVRVIGVGMFSGNYVVAGVTHSVSDGQFQTSMTLRANAPIGSATAESVLVRSWSEFGVDVNTQDPTDIPESMSGGRTRVDPQSDASSARRRALTTSFTGE